MSKSDLNTKQFNRAASADLCLSAMYVDGKLSPSAVASATKTIGTMGARLDNMIHATAVACIHLSMSIAEGGPASGAKPAADLLNAMPKGSRAKALAAWFEAYSNIRAKLVKKAGVSVWEAGVLPATAKTYAVPRPQEAMEKPFYSVEEKDTDPKAFTLGAALAALLRKAEAAAKDGKLSPEDQAVVDALRNAGKPALVKLEAK